MARLLNSIPWIGRSGILFHSTGQGDFNFIISQFGMVYKVFIKKYTAKKEKNMIKCGG